MKQFEDFCIENDKILLREILKDVNQHELCSAHELSRWQFSKS